MSVFGKVFGRLLGALCSNPRQQLQLVEVGIAMPVLKRAAFCKWRALMSVILTCDSRLLLFPGRDIGRRAYGFIAVYFEAELGKRPSVVGRDVRAKVLLASECSANPCLWRCGQLARPTYLSVAEEKLGTLASSRTIPQQQYT